MDSALSKEAIEQYNEIQEGIELEMNYIRLADLDGDWSGKCREVR